MHQLPTSKGFTLVEVLVTLVILSISTALVGPAVIKWLDARTANAARNELVNALAMLPLETERSGEPVVINDASRLDIESGGTIEIIRPIKILANGFCKGGELSLTLGNQRYNYVVHAPNCEVTLVGGN